MMGSLTILILLLLKLCWIMILLFEETIKEKHLTITSLLGMSCHSGKKLINFLMAYPHKKRNI